MDVNPLAELQLYSPLIPGRKVLEGCGMTVVLICAFTSDPRQQRSIYIRTDLNSRSKKGVAEGTKDALTGLRRTTPDFHVVSTLNSINIAIGNPHVEIETKEG